MKRNSGEDTVLFAFPSQASCTRRILTPLLLVMTLLGVPSKGEQEMYEDAGHQG